VGIVGRSLADPSGTSLQAQPREWDEGRRRRFHNLVQQLYLSVVGLDREFAAEGRRFTLDGHLVGSIGEVVAAYAFDLELLASGAETHDARAHDGTLVQIKLTGGSGGVGIYGKPDHLIVLQLSKMEIRLIYNGPGARVWEKCGKLQKNGQRRISLSNLQALEADASPETHKICQKRKFSELL